MKFVLPFLALASAQNQSAAKLKKQARSIRDNGLDVLFNNVDVSENMVISPLSVIGCMYMLAAGSAGETREQILTALDFGKVFGGNVPASAIETPFKSYKDVVDGLTNGQDNKGYTLDIANGMFYQANMESYSRKNSMSPAYVDLLRKNFITDVSNIEEVDFARNSVKVTEQINEWVSEQTNGMISELFKEPIDRQTLVVLASTLYFKASWNNKFQVLPADYESGLCFARSVDDLLHSVCDDVTWLHKEEDVFFYEWMHTPGSPIKKATMFEIPLKNTKAGNGQISNKFSMQIWMPDDYITTEEYDAAFRQFIKNQIQKVRRFARKEKTIIKIPKFSIDYSEDIKESLKSIGIESVFSEGQADLSPMLGSDSDGFVSKVNHAVKFDLDENGIEGAAVTSAEITSRTYSQPKLLNVDKPFYFVVTNRCWEEGGSGASCSYGNIPLFLGRVVKPTF